METPKIVDILNEFVFNLAECSISYREKEIKLVLPIELYKDLQYYVFQSGTTTSNTRDLIMRCNSDVTFTISCKEMEELKIGEKLKECFNILSK